jgi:hypothetical protein
MTDGKVTAGVKFMVALQKLKYKTQVPNRKTQIPRPKNQIPREKRKKRICV